MSPNPDFGYDTYKGYGRLAGKVMHVPPKNCIDSCHLVFVTVSVLAVSDAVACLAFTDGTDVCHHLKPSGSHHEAACIWHHIEASQARRKP